MRAIFTITILSMQFDIGAVHANQIVFTSCEDVANGKSTAARNLNDLLIQKLEHLWSVNLFTPQMLTRILATTEFDLPQFGQILITNQERHNSHNPAATTYSISEIANGIDTFFASHAASVNLATLKRWANQKLSEKNVESIELPKTQEYVASIEKTRADIRLAFDPSNSDQQKKEMLGQIDFSKYGDWELLLVTDCIREITGTAPLVELIRLQLQNLALRIVSIKQLDINEKSNEGNTALIQAAMGGHVRIIKTLVKRPDILLNEKNKEGNTALIEAAWRGHTKVATVLLAQPKVLINKKNRDGYSALIFAAAHGHSEVVEALLANTKILVNQKNKYGITALSEAASGGNIDIAKTLLSRSEIQVNLVNIHANTPLMHAAWSGHIDIVKALLERPDILINEKDLGGTTALMGAAWGGHIQVVESLLAKPEILVNEKNKYGNCSITEAAERGHIDIVKLLLSQPQIVVETNQIRFMDGVPIASRSQILELLKSPAGHSNESAGQP